MRPSSTKSNSLFSGSEWNTYRRLIRYAYPYGTRLFLGMVFGIVCGGSTVGLLLSLKKTLSAIFDPQYMPWPMVAGTVILLPLFGILLGIGNYVSTYFVVWVGNRVVMDLRSELFAHIQQLPLLYFSRSKTGELISRTTNDTLQIERAVSTVAIDLIREPFVLLASMGYLFWLDARLALLSFVLFPVCIIPVGLFGRRVRRYAREGQQKLADITSTLQETITGVKIVKAYGMEKRESNRFNEQAKAVFGRVMKVTRASAAIDPIVVSISFAGLSLALLYARWTGMSFDQFFTFGAALVMMYQPVKKLSKLNMAIQQGSGAADRIFELRDAPMVKDIDRAVDFEETIRTIEFRDVSFAYGDEPVLRDIGFMVSAGQRVAFVGCSGSGKSTLVSLLPRFFDVQSGEILINGKDSRTFTLKSLRRQIGLVTQETILFNDTVANNIAYGQTGASRPAIEEAARRAHAHEFIMQMSQGYDTVIGERGIRLSGGQCQRLAIARAILCNRPILILDEATSALDTESERQVQAALDELMAGRTVFAIAHRLSTIMHVDLILVLDKGSIVERGTHQELLARGGLYNYLYNLQFRDTAYAAMNLPDRVPGREEITD